MQRWIWPVAALLVLMASSPALGSESLPEIAMLHVGEYMAVIRNDSFGLRTGANTLTVEIPNLPAGDDVQLQFSGPKGELIDVPLRPFTATSEPPDMASMGHTSGHTMPAHANMEGGQPTHSHGAAQEGAGPAWSARGTAVIRSPGTWSLALRIRDANAVIQQSAASLQAQPGGPSKAYLGFAGVMMGGFLTYGIVKRGTYQRRGR